ncbi:MAG TPA: maleylpyruvate isomerase family mycothiol-dependent enzyme [Acidimicrobiales bacterium]|nr:maleylpyruvate isomerase family mycothiol-dependent enzyme [Acidimicrobiales bacterium]
MGEIGQLYAEGRGRTTELVSGLSPEQAAVPVPTCPQWSVHDVVAHLAGVCSDVLAGNIEGVASAPWTAAQVEARRDRSMAELVEEWSTAAPQVEAIAPLFPGRVGTQWVLDMTTHEHDIRCALGAPGARDTEAIGMSVEFLMGGFAATVVRAGLPPIEVRADDQSWVLGGEGSTDLEQLLLGAEPPLNGDVEPEGSVEAPAFEWFRALTGRRSIEQIRAFKWSVDPEPYLQAFTFGPFRPAAAPIVE